MAEMSKQASYVEAGGYLLVLNLLSAIGRVICLVLLGRLGCVGHERKGAQKMCWNSTEKILVGLLAMARESIRERGYERSSRLGFPLLAGQRKQALSGRGVRPLAVQ